MRILTTLLLPCLCLLAPLSLVAETLFQKAAWQYQYGPDQAQENWTKPEFPAAEWPLGNSPLGYGEEGLGTTIDFGQDPKKKPLTAWFRRDFELRALQAGEQVVAVLAMDDGAALYLNGKEVARRNLPKGPLKADTTAVRSLSDDNEGYYMRIPLPAADLKPGGKNTLAVEVHQSEASSSDLFFDLILKVMPGQVATVKLEKESGKVVTTYRETHRVDFDLPIPDGYIDGGRRMKFASDGTATSGREILLVDRKADQKLSEYVAWARELAKSESDPAQRLKKLVAYVHDINTPDATDKWLGAYVEDMTEEFANKPLMIGVLLEQCESGVCRHRSLLLKILGDEAGLPTALVRGNYHQAGSAPLSGAHAWNEVKLPDGKILLVDVMHNGAKPKFIPTTDPSIAKRYLRENDKAWYGTDGGQSEQTIKVSGGVRHPGAVLFQKGMSISSAITLCGGLTVDSDDVKKIKLIRNQTERTIDLKKLRSEPLDLQPGDEIVVPER